MFPYLPDSSEDVQEVRFERKFFQGHVRLPYGENVPTLDFHLNIFFGTWSPFVFYNTYRWACMYYKRQNISSSKGRVSLGATQLIVARLGLWREAQLSKPPG